MKLQEMRVSWKETSESIKRLENRIKNSSVSHDSILVLNRGSMIIAGILAYRLGIRKIEYIDIDVIYKNSYKEVEEIIVNSKLNKGNIMGRVLLITDVAHTGNTIGAGVELLRAKYPDNLLDFATVYYMTSSKIKPNYYAEKMGPKWVVFPWDEKGYVPMSNHI